MKKLDRRAFLKLTSFAGAGVLAAGLPIWKTDARETALVFITDIPEKDTERLLAIASEYLNKKPTIETQLIAPTAQDLSLVRDTELMDPTCSSKVPAEIRTFTSELRQRKNVGGYCVTMSSGKDESGDKVTFEVDGRIIEEVDRSGHYENITIAGAQGDTRFALRNGKLSAVHSSCKHDICVKMGEKKSGRIICAPNKLVATINGPRQVDSITG